MQTNRASPVDTAPVGIDMRIRGQVMSAIGSEWGVPLDHSGTAEPRILLLLTT